VRGARCLAKRLLRVAGALVQTHESKTDPDSRLYRKDDKTASELRYMGHTLTDNRHGLVVNALVTHADGYAEREAAKAMINDARQALDDSGTEVTLSRQGLRRRGIHRRACWI
jgi:hypothetical protein